MKQLRAHAGLVAIFAALVSATLCAQQGSSPAAPQTTPASSQPQPQQDQPPPFTAPDPPTPDAMHAPGQQRVPQQLHPEDTPEAPLPQPDRSTIDLRGLAPLALQPPAANTTSPDIQRNANGKTVPGAEAPSFPRMRFFNLVGAYHPPALPPLRMDSPTPLDNLIRDGKLYLSLHDAIVLAVQNNLDVEVSRYNLLLAETDVTRARGGGNLRGLDYTIVQPPSGVGSVTSPLLVTATATGNASPTSVNVTDLSQVTQSGSTAQQTLSESGTSTYSTGPSLPLFDPVLTGEAGYLRRSDQTSLITTAGSSTSSSGTSGSGTQGTGTTSGALQYVAAGLDLKQGFSTGAELDAFVDNTSQVLYAGNSQYDPAHAPSASATLTQPLLRGRGREVNLRFVRIAQLDRKVSRLVFEEQLLETIYGVSRLYYDLVSLGENVGVKQEALAAAQKLYEDDRSQVEIGTLAPIELTRAQALLSSSRLDLIQARGEYRQQEVILREQLLRQLGPGAAFASIVPTDTIVVPDDQPALDVTALTADALARRPDLAQAALQVQADQLSVNASRNNVKPLLNLYGNVQSRGSSLVPYEDLGSLGTGTAQVPTALFQGGLRLSTIYQGGLQLNMPLRNRIAQADAARDSIQLRQAEGRTAKLENDIRQQIENSAIALETAHQAYAAAVESRNYQQQLLQAEIDKLSVGESTNYLVVQDEAYLAQARSTEVAARSDWVKAQLSLERSLGNLLERNQIQLDDAIQERVK